MSVRTRSSVVVRSLALALAASLAAGCGGEPPPTPVDPSVARGFLVQALDAWKAGKPSNSLAKGTPSIMVNDPDWDRKMKLNDYKLEGDGQTLGAGVKWSVPLTLNAKGKTLEKKAEYVVNVSEGFVSISRMDMDL
jgi:hypothetical protein